MNTPDTFDEQEKHMKAKCMNSVPLPGAKNRADMAQRVVCGWEGEVPKVKNYPCPRCSMQTLAPVVEI